MERKDLMVSLVRSITDRLNTNVPFSAACLTSINDSLDADKTRDAIDNILIEKPATSYTTLLKKYIICPKMKISMSWIKP